MKKLIIIALVVISAVAGAATLNSNSKEDIKETTLPVQDFSSTKSSKIGTWD